MAEYKSKYKKKSAGRRLPVLLLALVLAVAAVWGVSARYIRQLQADDSVVKAPEFYFTSDYLLEGGATYDLNPGTASVTFVLRNHEDSLRYSPGTLSYSVTTDNGSFASSGDPVTLIQGTFADTNDVAITLYGLENGGSYTVTATGQNGYQKTITATFRVKTGDPGVYRHVENGSAYVLLTVWTKDASGQVSITFPNGLIPDTTDPTLRNIQNYNGSYQGGTYALDTLGTYSSHTYRFFKDSAYTGGDFTVTVGGITAQPRQPE